MKRPQPPAEPNYLRKLRYLWCAGRLPRVGLHLIDILHDDWCSVFAGWCCDCDPTIRLKGTVPGEDPPSGDAA